MAIKYWEFEDAPLREKLKNPNVKEISKIYFENENRAYRFAKALLEVKQKGSLRLKDCSNVLPPATWKRYLDFGVEVGILKHEEGTYSFTDRYSRPFKNIAAYIKAWVDLPSAEDADVLFANVRTEKQMKRGGRVSASETSQAPQNPELQNASPNPIPDEKPA